LSENEEPFLLEEIVKTKGWFKLDIYSEDYPSHAGNYAIYVTENNYMGKNKIALMYIGTALDLKKRLTTHPVLSTLIAIAEAEICWFDRLIVKCSIVMFPRERKKREFNLINRIQPIINKQGK